jgi:hypothetical protein
MALTRAAGLEGEGDENAMAEHEEYPSANDQPEQRGERSEASRTPDEASRRAFIRKTAEGAAFSLFGVMGLDAVVEKVVQRLEDVPASRSLARATGELLHDAGIGRMAFAADGCNCPPEMPGAPNFTCAWDQNYTCPQNFSCPDNMGFQCNPFRFECTAPNFVCTGIGGFSCTAGYLCPGQGLYAPDCNPQIVSCGVESYDCNPLPGIQHSCPTPNQFDCTASGRFNLSCGSTPVECTGADSYTCGVVWIFDCGQQTPDGKFSCSAGKFDCSGDTLYDFRCFYSFDCHEGFTCSGNHVHACGWPGREGNFECAGGANISFTCAAGGNRCNEPGTGNYGGPVGGDQRPGDFYCVGAAGDPRFTCGNEFGGEFNCQGVDDFKCTGSGGNNFVCADQLQFHCAPTGGGVFLCDRITGQYNPFP